MSQPSKAQVHLDAPLTQISIAYAQKAESFIADKLAPIVNVDKQSNRYFIFDKSSMFRDEAQLRAPATESAGSGYALSSDTYFADVFALHKDISDQDRANTDAPLDADRNATQFITQKLLIKRERAVAAAAMVSSVWATDKTVATQWSDVLSDPFTDIEDGKRAILVSTGQMANTLALGYDVMKALKNHPSIIDRIKYTSDRTVTADVLARLFEVDRVVVASAVVDAAAEGKTGSFSFIHGKNALLAHVAPSPGIEVPSALYMFAWSGLAPGLSSMGMAISKFRMEHLKADRVEGELAIDVKVTGSDLGYFFPSVVA